jgi:hypothetical protein
MHVAVANVAFKSKTKDKDRASHLLAPQNDFAAFQLASKRVSECLN